MQKVPPSNDSDPNLPTYLQRPVMYFFFSTRLEIVGKKTSKKILKPLGRPESSYLLAYIHPLFFFAPRLVDDTNKAMT